MKEEIGIESTEDSMGKVKVLEEAEMRRSQQEKKIGEEQGEEGERLEKGKVQPVGEVGSVESILDRVDEL